MRGHPLVEQAHATLCRLADAAPATDAVNATIGEIERAWEKPFALGIGGDLQARTELLNVVCDGQVFDPHDRALGGAAVRVKRGTIAGFRAVRDDGSVEEQQMPPDRTQDIATARARATAARGEYSERENAIVRVEGTLSRRPAWWAIWLWPMYWLAMWRSKQRRTDRKLADLALTEARAQLDTGESDATAIEAHVRLATKRYYESLRSLASGGPIGAGVVEVDIIVAKSPLPENTELVELSGASRAGAEVDAVLLAQGDKIFAPVRGGHPLAVGDHAQLLGALPTLLADARALRLAKRVERKIRTVLASLADAIERKEATFRSRIARLQALRIEDPSAFARTQLERVHGDISASVNAVVEHSSVHLGSELAQLQHEWVGSIADAADADVLKAALAKVDEEWHTRPRRIAEEVRVLVVGGLGGSARDLYPTVVEALHAYGLPEEHMKLRAAPELPPITLFPSLTKNSTKLERSNWFVGLFRSFETRRTELRGKVHDKVEHMREVAGSELLDAEPRLHHAIGTALTNLLETALGHQGAWLDAALDEERAQVTRDREAILPLLSVHDAVRAETSRLAEMIAQLERQQPAIAVAAAAAETASLSR
ncbi:MAG: hypothetical protein M4D80_34635 [Myxococcota bacterium]|nr:hypothetical protein [Myxococcota bacterium]